MLFTLKETAILSEVSEKTIRHSLAEKIPPAVERETGSYRVFFSLRHLLYFRLVSRMPVAFEQPLDERLAIHNVIVGRSPRSGCWSMFRSSLVRTHPEVPLSIDLRAIESVVATRARAYVRGKRRIATSSSVLGGEPVFAGTRVAVAHVGALVEKGVPFGTLLEEFPQLDEGDLRFAGLYVQVGDPPGRPRKKLEIRRRGKGTR